MRNRSKGFILLTGLFIMLTGCNKLFLYDIKNGQRNISSAYYHLEKASDFDTTITLKNVKIRIVGDRNKFLGPNALNESVKGYVKINKDDSAEIYVFGYRVQDKIVVNQLVLGHEINHILSHRNPDIADPDTLKELFE